MNHARSHRGHMWLIATAAVGVLLLGSGIGVAVAVAVLACGVMLAAIFWFLRQSARQPYAPDTHHEGVRRH